MDGKGEHQDRNEEEEGGMCAAHGETCSQGWATPQDRALVLLSASRCCCGSMSQFPSLLSELLAGKCFATGSLGCSEFVS